VLRHRTYCRYSEFTWDVGENQVLKYVCYLLSGWRFRRKGLTGRLVALDVQLDEISYRPFTSADVSRFVYQRHNEAYRPSHSLCALLLESASLSEAAGVNEFRTFLLDMNKLFEKFVGQILVDRCAESSWSATEQEGHWLARAGRIGIIPDLVIRYGAAICSIADCKFKRISQESDYHNHDYYQVLAYCTALKVDRGVLIYPKHELEIEDEARILHSDVVIRRMSVDLSGTPAQLRAACDRLAKEILDWSGAQIVVAA